MTDNKCHKTARTGKAYRCAVYTRKSSEEGLDQDFSSLDAQRESADCDTPSDSAIPDARGHHDFLFA